MFFSRYASKVTILVRRTLSETMSQYLIDQIATTPNIEVRLHTEVVEAKGANRLDAIAIRNSETGETETLPAAAMFMFIGAVPHSEPVAGVVERNEAGFIFTGDDVNRNGRRPKRWSPQRDPFLLETSVPGIFAAGDVRHGAVRRVASAVGEGSIGISFVHQYLKEV
jgi:thioredoxin reductase (NADPH)